MAESAYLAALPQAPTYYSPYGRHQGDLENRKNMVLDNMRELGYIGDEELAQAKAEEVTFLEKNDTGIKAPHFVFYIKDYLEKKYGIGVIETGGLKVTTTLDMNLQEMAEEAVAEEVVDLAKLNVSNGAAMITDAKTGEFFEKWSNRVNQDNN